MKVNLDQLLEGVSRLPRQKLTEENSEKLRRYDYLLDLLTEDYISSEHLAVPEAECTNLRNFIRIVRHRVKQRPSRKDPNPNKQP